ncbi:molybdopterin oxidoreductase family protein [Mycobacterium xenopi 4042]|uniref:Molybdopterin oxidoreductase family protein n=1 Tax=Mycobacterium xenopi 4042 TaxID=1299334 RepID=X7Z2N2_MYCXE|nr:molybdopterin oxidoreductase family protein [Mycobacterium xenopi 4042]
MLIGGVEPDDLADPQAALAALDAASFVVSLELRHSPVTERADVVFPIAPAVEKSGTFVNWEGRYRGFPVALGDTGAIPDLRVLDTLADEMGVDLGLPTVEAARDELVALGPWDGESDTGPTFPPQRRLGPGRVRLCWPVGGYCSTAAACKTANRIWPAPHASRWRGCQRNRRPKSAQPKVIW